MPTWTIRSVPSSAFFMRRAVVRVERHRLFLVDVLARLDRGDEVKRMQVLRRGDQHGVDRLVVEQLAIVAVGRRPRRDRLGLVEPPGVDVGDRRRLDVRAADRGLQDLLAAPAGADQAEPDAIVGPPNPAPGRRRRGRCRAGHRGAGRSTDHRPQESATARHDSPPGRNKQQERTERAHATTTQGAASQPPIITRPNAERSLPILFLASPIPSRPVGRSRIGLEANSVLCYVSDRSQARSPGRGYGMERLPCFPFS